MPFKKTQKNKEKLHNLMADNEGLWWVLGDLPIFLKKLLSLQVSQVLHQYRKTY